MSRYKVTVFPAEEKSSNRKIKSLIDLVLSLNALVLDDSQAMRYKLSTPATSFYTVTRNKISFHLAVLLSS